MIKMLDTPRRLLHEWNTRQKNQNRVDELERILTSRDPVLLVHQMGRAGSMTTVNSLRDAGLHLPVFHTHWLNPASVQKRLHWVAHLPESRQPLNIQISRRIAEALTHEGIRRRHWTLVTVYREPIARNVSVFFLSIDAFVENFAKRFASGEIDKEQLFQIFLRDFPHDQPLTWFDREVKEVFGIDVYEQAFPHNRGYQIVRSEQVDLLVIKLEQLNHCYRDAFSDYLGITLPKLAHTHITEKDPSKPMYKEFVNATSMPDDYLNYMYGSRFAQHFYTQDELIDFQKKWSSTSR